MSANACTGVLSKAKWSPSAAFSHRMVVMQTNNPKDPACIKDLLRDSSFSSMIRKAQALLKIEQALVDILPGDVGRHCRVMNHNCDALVIATDSGSLATSLRFREDELLNEIQRHTQFHSINSIQVCVRPKR